MAQRLVAADASPLIGPAAAGGFELLHKLFGTVTVTAAVRDEVVAGRELPGARELSAAIQTGWINVARVPSGVETFPDLDLGEASTLLPAIKRGPKSLVLMDEPLGRAHARTRGIAVTGLAGVLLSAKRAGLVRNLRPFFERLAQSDSRISADLVRAILDEAGEA